MDGARRRCSRSIILGTLWMGSSTIPQIMDCAMLRVQSIIPGILWMDPSSIIFLGLWIALALALPIHNLRDIIDQFLIYNGPWIMNGACPVTSGP